MENPLIPALLLLLRQYSEGVGEYELMRALEAGGAFAGLTDQNANDPSRDLLLFQKHFMIMNGLYRLQQRLWDEELAYLEISPLCIRLIGCDRHKALVDKGGEGARKLRDFYLDWRHLSETSEADVQKMLADFWRRYQGLETRAEALTVLALAEEAAPSEIVHRYRELAARHHPDRGGDPERFMEVRWAYEILTGGR